MRKISFAIIALMLVFAVNLQANDLRIFKNEGQFNSESKYFAYLKNGALFLDDSSLTFSFFGKQHQHSEHDHNLAIPEHDLTDVIFQVIKINFLGANPNVVLTPTDSMPGKFSFYLGNDPTKWVSGCNAFNRITYKNIYPNVDFILEQKSDVLAYRFELAPNTDASQIKMEILGADSNVVGHELVNHLQFGTLTHTQPIAWQTFANNQMAEVPVSFSLQGNVFGFDVQSAADARLTIDPDLIFSTYSGSLADNWGNTATYDLQGNAYAAGTVFGSGFPTTPGVFDTTFNGVGFVYQTFDVGILKFSPDGSQLLYGLYLGGNEADLPISIITDAQQNLYVLGITSSANFAVTQSGFSTVFSGGVLTTPISLQFTNGSDYFVAKFNADGSQLLASTYLGGSGNEGIPEAALVINQNYGDVFRGEINLDAANRIWVAGSTNSPDAPTVNPFQANIAGGRDGYVARFNNNLSALEFASFIGTSAADVLFAVHILPNGNAVVAGGTTGSNLPNVASGMLPTKPGNLDGFASLINTTGQLISSTFIGTPQTDQVYFVQSDSLNNIYLLGQTNGVIPRTPNAYGRDSTGQFIIKLSPNLSSVLLSTTIGSTPNQPNISPTAFLVDACQRVYISGWGGVTNAGSLAKGNTFNLPTTTNGFDTLTDGSDFYLMVIDKNFNKLEYATFIGGNTPFNTAITGHEHVDGGTSRFDPQGKVYQAVCASCGNLRTIFPAWPPSSVWASHDESANCNNAVFKFDLQIGNTAFITLNDTICAPAAVTFVNKSSGGAQYKWNFGDGFLQIDPGDTIRHTFQSRGKYFIVLETMNSEGLCLTRTTTTDTVWVFGVPKIEPQIINFCPGERINAGINLGSEYQFSWSPRNGVANPTAATSLVTPPGNEIYSIAITDSGRCTGKAFIEFVELSGGTSFDSVFICYQQPATFILPDSLLMPATYFYNQMVFPNQRELTTQPVIDTFTVKVTAPSKSSKCLSEVVTFVQPVKVDVDFNTSITYNGCYGWPLYTFEIDTVFGGSTVWLVGNDTLTKNANSVILQSQNNSELKVSLISNSKGCISLADTVLNPVFSDLPNIITPNGDGLNDFLNLEQSVYKNVSLTILNRWGVKVFDTNDYANNFNGDDLSEGVYFYLLKTDPDAEPCTGWVHIIK